MRFFPKNTAESGRGKWFGWPLRITIAILTMIALLIIFGKWDWFIPLIENRASAALGRRVTISHLHVHPARVTRVEVDGLGIAQPKNFSDREDSFASVKRILVSFDVWHYIRTRRISLPVIEIDSPRADLAARANGEANYQFGPSKPSKSQGEFDMSSLPSIGDLSIRDGAVHVDLAKPKANMNIAIQTATQRSDGDRDILIKAQGQYSNAPITARAQVGSLKDLTQHTRPFPIKAEVENGPTKVDLNGVVNDPLHFKGTNLQLHFSGPDMALLYGLTGVPIPHTPAYDVKGKLDYSPERIRFSDFAGRMGRSDINGVISVDPRQKPLYVDARLNSKNVDLEDLGGFIGTKPGAGKDEAQERKGRFLPSDPINMPKLKSVDAHLVYHGDHIQNKKTPFDDINADIKVIKGEIDIKRLSYAIGPGELFLKGTLKPVASNQFSANLALDAKRVPIGKLLQSLGGSDSQGRLGGHAKLVSRGNSIASLLGHGQGGIALVVDQGGSITALLPDLLGLKLGSALLSALGVPKKTNLQCFVADLPLNHGVLDTRAFLLQTDSTRTLGGGTIDLRSEHLDYHISTRSTSFTVLSLPGQVNISGSLRDPSILPGAEIIGRAAATAALAFVFPPALVLPTIQFGVGKGSACEDALGTLSNDPSSGMTPDSRSQPASGSEKATQPGILTPAQINAVWQKRLKDHAAPNPR